MILKQRILWNNFLYSFVVFFLLELLVIMLLPFKIEIITVLFSINQLKKPSCVFCISVYKGRSLFTPIFNPNGKELYLLHFRNQYLHIMVQIKIIKAYSINNAKASEPIFCFRFSLFWITILSCLLFFGSKSNKSIKPKRENPDPDK
jgi:hypothetical protein